MSCRRAARRLRAGVALTYVAVGLMALAASSSWWPTTGSTDIGDAGALVRITNQTGQTACGTIVEGPAAIIRLATAGGQVDLATTQLAAIVPVDGC